MRRPRLTRTFRISGLTVLAGVLLVAVPGAPEGIRAIGAITLVFAGLVFVVSAVRLLFRGLLWRVGSRLLVSYVLIGLVPIPLIFGLVFAGICVVAGQLAARRAEMALKERETAVVSLGREVASRLDTAGTAARRRELFEQAASKRPDLPDLGFAYLRAGQEAEGKGALPAASIHLPESAAAEERLIGRFDKELFFVTRLQAPGGVLVLSLPFGPSLKRLLEEETGVRVETYLARLEPGDARSDKSKGLAFSITSGKETARIDLGDETREPDVTFEAEPKEGTPAAAVKDALQKSAQEKAAAGFDILRKPWLHWLLPIEHSVVDLRAGAVDPKGRLVVGVRTSIAREAETLFGHERFGTTSEMETGRVVFMVMRGLAIFTFVIYVLAALLAAVLVLRIARATRRLSTGFAEIEKGNFTTHVSLKGEDQLATLVGSFNAMAGHLSESVAARAEKEALERELEVARTLQRQLLPPADFTFGGADIAVDFRPAAVIGGDFYDLVGDRDALTVVLADVSGHGLPTGIVMASARASLSALAKTGVTGGSLLTLLDEEIRRTTSGRTFVTLAHLVFRFDERRVDFTNAGHLYPYCVSAKGDVAPLVNPARPLGVALPGTFRTVSAPLRSGDTWVVLSDGIIEATPAGSDEAFGFKRLESVLGEGRGLSAAALRDRILDAWRAFTATDEPADDRTLVIVRILDRDQPLSGSA